MNAGKWARELFALDDGKTVCASQEDHTVFWDAATGKEIGRVPEHVYGFSHDQKHLIAQNGKDKVSIYEYPAMKRVAQFPSPYSGIKEFLFSPDDRYYIIQSYTGYPAPEDTYPAPHYSFHNTQETRFYCLDPPGEVTLAARAPVYGIGSFAADSSAYFGTTFSILVGDDWIEAPWRYNFKTRKVTAVKFQK